MCKSSINEKELYNPDIHHLFRSKFSSLLYIERSTRPDICYSTCVLSTKLNSPSTADLARAKRIFHYLSCTINTKLKFVKSCSFNFDCFTDANFGTEKKGLSRTGVCIYVLDNLIYWNSKLQTVPAKSTTESEWYDIDYGLRHSFFFKFILNDLFFDVKMIRIRSDNLPAIKLCNHLDKTVSTRTKHVERCFYYIRYYIEKGDVTLTYVNTKFQVADVFAKILSKQDHSKFVEMLGLS